LFVYLFGLVWFFVCFVFNHFEFYKDRINQLTRQLSNYISIDDAKGINIKELKLDSSHRFDVKKKEIDRKMTLERALKTIEVK